jgi:hypothetical protein
VWFLVVGVDIDNVPLSDRVGGGGGLFVCGCSGRR